jgi:hypothetical protein
MKLDQNVVALVGSFVLGLGIGKSYSDIGLYWKHNNIRPIFAYKLKDKVEFLTEDGYYRR